MIIDYLSVSSVSYKFLGELCHFSVQVVHDHEYNGGASYCLCLVLKYGVRSHQCTVRHKPVIKRHKPVIKRHKPVIKRHKPVIKRHKPVIKRNKPVIRKGIHLNVEGYCTG